MQTAEINVLPPKFDNHFTGAIHPRGNTAFALQGQARHNARIRVAPLFGRGWGSLA
ncbi:MAG: hypothetical protein Cons2KO_10350 [Congregibacter sp.]